MTRLKLYPRAAGLGLVLLAGAARILFPQGYDVAAVRRVYDLVDKIQSETRTRPEGDVRQVELTEGEFNSYIAYRIEAEKEEVMKALELKFLPDNKLEGRVFIDLKGQNIPRLLKPEMNLYLAGRLETRDRKLRIDLQKLFIEGQPVQPRLLDFIISVGCMITGDDPWSLGDWF